MRQRRRLWSLPDECHTNPPTCRQKNEIPRSDGCAGQGKRVGKGCRVGVRYGEDKSGRVIRTHKDGRGEILRVITIT